MFRRDFLRTGAAMGIAASMPFHAFGKIQSEKTRIAFIGVGLRGRNHLQNLLLRSDVVIPAICDIDGVIIATPWLWHTRMAVDTIPEHEWEEMDEYLKKYDHPLWKKYGEYAEGSGHGGMDYFVDNAFVEVVKRKLEAPLDAYDAAAWSAITPLSERSIENNGEPQDFPDFTRGQWMKRKPGFALTDDF